MKRKFSYNEVKKELIRQEKLGIVGDVPASTALEWLKEFMDNEGAGPDDPIFSWKEYEMHLNITDAYDRAMRGVI